MSARRFVGYRPKVPAHYIEGGYGNLPHEAQFEGVQFTDGTVAVRWLTQYRSTSLWPSFDEFQAVHGHADYETRIDWLDLGENAPSSVTSPTTDETTQPCGRCGEPEASVRHQSTTFAIARAVRAHAFQPSPTPTEKAGELRDDE